MLLGALADNRGNLTRAAQAVGYEREMFESALRRFGISEVM